MNPKNLVGLIGWPIEHSLSPAMHNEAFRILGLDSWVYVSLPVQHNNIKEAIFGLKALCFKGANITIPYKEVVVPYLDKLSEDAKIIEAVNTIVIDEKGLLIGHNTDHAGFIKDLADNAVEISKKNILVLGAGGAAKAICYGLLHNGAQNLMILNRTKNKSDELAHTLRYKFNTSHIQSIEKYAHADLVINCTSVGLDKTSQAMPWDKNISFNKNQIVYDTIYNPYETPLLAFAKSCGAKTINGLGMLINQAALAFELWTQHKAPIKDMQKIAYAKLNIK